MSVAKDADTLYDELWRNVGYWQDRRTIEAACGLGRCEAAAAVKYCRDVTCLDRQGPPLLTRPGEIALAQNATQYRDSRTWEFRYNRSRVRTACQNARAAARRFAGQQGSSRMQTDVFLLRTAEVFLSALLRGEEYTPAQMTRAITRIVGLTPDQRTPSLDDLFA